MPALLLGPLLRYVGERDATVWVETSEPCEVEVLGCRGRGFRVAGHHYALVHVDGLEPGETCEYEVRLDGEVAWPEEGSPFPASVIRTLEPGTPLDVVFGSCRVTVPHEPPYTLSADDHPEGREVDALHTFALRMRGLPPERWPRLLLLLGDQVYADEGAPETREFVRARRDVRRPPGEDVADFEEYTRLYREAWSEPTIRWFLSTVPSAMVFDDHDVHDDWNTSETWLREMRAKPWWEERIVGALMSYWIYQHIGNLSPRELARDELFGRVAELDDAAPLLREFAHRADRETAGTRWSFCRDLGRTRLLMIDSRAGRVLEGSRRRRMVDADEWDWIERHATGDVDHLLLGTSLPVLLTPGLQGVESWSEAVTAGAWGRRAARIGERVRQVLDLEHWAAFGESFDELVALLGEVASGRRGGPPATIVALSGDVHHAYVAEVAFRRSVGARSAVYQAVCSPFRNALDAQERYAVRLGATPAGALAGAALARSAGVPPPSIRWRLVQKPAFDNQVATLSIEGRRALLRIERALRDSGSHRLETTFERRLA